MMRLNSQRVLAFIVLIGILFFTGSLAQSHHLQDTMKIKTILNGKVETIIDGDTFRLVLHGKEKLICRMAFIDAPDFGQPMAEAAT